jgi:hypothetical protein
MYGGVKAQLHAFLILVIFIEQLHTCGYAVVQLVKALLYKAADSIPDGVTGIYLIIPADNLTPLCADCPEILAASISCSPKGFPGLYRDCSNWLYV